MNWKFWEKKEVGQSEQLSDYHAENPSEPWPEPEPEPLTEYQKAARLEYRFLMSMSKPRGKKALYGLAAQQEAGFQRLAAQENGFRNVQDQLGRYGLQQAAGFGANPFPWH